MKFSAVAAFAFIFLESPAQGSLILSLDATPSSIMSGADLGDFVVTYHADLSGDGRLDPVATLGSTCVGMGGTLIPCSPTGAFFTVYDVAGFVSANAPPLNWFVTVQPRKATRDSIFPIALLGRRKTNHEAAVGIAKRVHRIGPVMRGAELGSQRNLCRIFASFQIEPQVAG